MILRSTRAFHSGRELYSKSTLHNRTEPSATLPETMTAAAIPVDTPPSYEVDSRRPLVVSALAILVAAGAAVAAELLTALIGLVTNFAFYGRISRAFVSPADNRLGLFVIIVPVLGALVVGVMARYGSGAIRGHGIPEAMEQILTNESRISPRVTILKPLSAAVAIGTGGPFGAEGPIIATGGALGSLLGQLLHITADERKVLLAAGAAAGMAAIFGSPVSAVLLAIELLLFEYRPRSLIPVALASATAAGIRVALEGPDAVFAMEAIAQPSGGALVAYIVLGAVVGVAAVYVTRALYYIEEQFERLPVHWMWWPAIGAVVVGMVGYIAPRTLGVGYDNIQGILAGRIAGIALLTLVTLKFVSWSVALGSGTSGGTLAPLFTIGGGLGAMLGTIVSAAFPSLGVDPRIAALVGMAAIFAGASRALLTSVVFAFETTRQPIGLLPLLGGCSAAFLISSLMMRYTIMTEKLARRGTRIPTDYAADFLDQLSVKQFATRDVVGIAADDLVEDARDWIASRTDGSSHQGFPVVEEDGTLMGVVTRRDLAAPAAHADQLVRELVKRAPVVAYEDNSLREVADHMVRAEVGRLPVVRRDDPRQVVGMITRGDLLAAHAHRLHAATRRGQVMRLTVGLRGERQQSPAS